MQWFQIKEQSAGKKRLALMWFCYKIFGEWIFYLSAFLMGTLTFLFAPSVRNYSKKYFTVIEKYTKLKPSLINQYKHIYSFANSLADKILIYNGKFDANRLVFENIEEKNKLFDDIANGKGIFFICNHVGNVEALQTLFFHKELTRKFNICIFMSNKQSQIFNNFLKTIKTDYPLKMFPVENIGLNTGVELKEHLDSGDVAFIAGDRLAQDNDTKNIKVTLFDKEILLPKGTFKLAKLMDVPTYFVSAVRSGKNYKIYLEKQNSLKEKDLIDSYIKNLERIVLENPFQFYHFYDFFNL